MLASGSDLDHPQFHAMTDAQIKRRQEEQRVGGLSEQSLASSDLYSRSNMRNNRIINPL